MTANAALAKTTWFRVGGPAEVLFRPADADDLAKFLGDKPDDVPVTVIGVGSNVLVRDNGISGVVIRLGDEFSKISIEGDNIMAGAGASNLKVANAARDAGLSGLEFLSGIPGSIGGSCRMNAGAFDREMKDVVRSVNGLSGTGDGLELSAREMGFSYRHTDIDENVIFTEAVLTGGSGDKKDIAERMKEIQTERTTSQPVKTPTGGSTFTNPPGEKAWELIDHAGCRGLRRGGAMVSEKHCNFLINTGNSSAADLEGLGEEVRRRVFNETGIKLDWEIRRIGLPAEPIVQEVTS
jgi:UDP-N-acetylmuramate dehydrogenase